MTDTIFTILYQTTGIYLLTLVLSRILGRKLISQMTFFDFVVGVSLGSAVVTASTVQSNQSLSGLLILVTITLLSVILDFTHIKSFIFRKLINSEPVIVIESGQIVAANMKKIRLSVDELMMKLREKNAFNIAEVEYAIMETDGKLSVQKKSFNQPLTPSDLNLTTPYKGLSRDLIIDGKILEENLSYLKLDKKWLINQIKRYGIIDVKEVFYTGIDSSGNLYVSKRQSTSENPGKHGIE